VKQKKFHGKLSSVQFGALERLLAGAEIRCLLLVEAFDNGEELLKAADRLGLEGIVSKRHSLPYRSGPCRDWRKIKTTACKAANSHLLGAGSSCRRAISAVGQPPVRTLTTFRSVETDARK
jgi:hypothetical protein